MDVTKASVGTILTAIHNFSARSADEITLVKGDSIELVERDDDFGDGWYLGKHIATGKTGLFPAVYTTPIKTDSKAALTTPINPPSRDIDSKEPPPNHPPFLGTVASSTAPGTHETEGGVGLRDQVDSFSDDKALSNGVSHQIGNTDPSHVRDSTATAPGHLNVARTKSLSRSSTGGSISASGAKDQPIGDREDHVKSPVMTETLSVIQEHISDMSSPRRNDRVDRRDHPDGGSSYGGSHPSQSGSYIAGSETDDEDSPGITEAEVVSWSPEQVAVYLGDIGVERVHCQIFEEQDINGEVLLGLEQSSLFLKEFELGSVGRRLRTWQKIKAFQDAINRPITPKPSRSSGRRTTLDGSYDTRRSRASTSTGMLDKASISETSVSIQQDTADQTKNSFDSASYQVSSQTLTAEPSTISSTPQTPTSPDKSRRLSLSSIRNSPSRPQRHISVDSIKAPIVTHLADGGVSVSPGRVPPTAYTVKSPFENPAHSSGSSRLSTSRASFFGHRLSASMDRNQLTGLRDSGYPNNKDVDRGYFSSTEAEKSRHLLRKRDHPPHSRNGSYTDETRRRSGLFSHIRLPSIGSSRAEEDNAYVTILSSPSTSHHSFDGKLRSPTFPHDPSAQSDHSKPDPPPKDGMLHSSQRLSEATVNIVSPSPEGSDVQSLDQDSPLPSISSGATKTSRFRSSRSISAAITGKEKEAVAMGPPPKSVSVETPQRTSSQASSITSPSDPRNSSTINGKLPSASARRKGKKHTSAYLKGLEKKSPFEQIADSDCSGWMKKKNTRLMTTWKPRLFVLRGRRLSYYYSEEDQEERGLIDISGHRVLPANDERITGLHASLTGAAQVVPKDPNSPNPSKSNDDDMFIFKLVPPRAGMSKAVNFTKPTIHYFAVENLAEGRRWMAALMKATIDRDESGRVITSYALKTISLTKARAMRQRPPALMNSDDEGDIPGDNEDVAEATNEIKPDGVVETNTASGDKSTRVSDDKPRSVSENKSLADGEDKGSIELPKRSIEHSGSLDGITIDTTPLGETINNDTVLHGARQSLETGTQGSHGISA
jgi:hypothetical protein